MTTATGQRAIGWMNGWRMGDHPNKPNQSPFCRRGLGGRKHMYNPRPVHPIIRTAACGGLIGWTLVASGWVDDWVDNWVAHGWPPNTKWVMGGGVYLWAHPTQSAASRTCVAAS